MAILKRVASSERSKERRPTVHSGELAVLTIKLGG